jgi:hypothetical protein
MQALCLEVLQDLAPAHARGPASPGEGELWGARPGNVTPLRRAARSWWRSSNSEGR